MLRSTKFWVSTTSLAIIAAAVWGFSAMATPAPSDEAGLPPEVSVENLKAQSKDIAKMSDTMLAVFQRDDLTPEQRRELGKRMRDVFMDTLNEHIDEYFTAPEDQKIAVLDRHIDDWQAQMKAMEEARKKWEEYMDKRMAEAGAETEEERRAQWREMFGRGQRPDQQERKTRSEGRDPNQMARRFSYFMAAQKRMSDRGIEMKWGNWGRRGGNSDKAQKKPDKRNDEG